MSVHTCRVIKDLGDYQTQEEAAVLQAKNKGKRGVLVKCWVVQKERRF